MSTPPNVVFFFTDDQRFDTIRALGNPAIHTPNMDRLAARGTAFTHAHIPCGTSGAVCMPSRAMLHIQSAGQEIPPEHITLGECFRAAGYRTFGTGKWHNGRAAYHRSFTDGDEIMFGGMADHWNVPVYHYDPTGRYATTLPSVPNAFGDNIVKMREADHINSGVHSSTMIADAALRFLAGWTDNTPYFMYLSFLAPHDPRTMPERFRQMYDPASIELPPNFTGGHPFDTGALRIRDEMLAAFPRDPEETRCHIAEYYAMITHLDDELGRVLTAIEARGDLDNTIIVFAGDNGLAVGQHGLFGKQNCYEHSVRVPLIFAGPGIPAGQRTDAYAYLFDIFPTLCDLTGLATPASVEGRSLVNPMCDPADRGRETLYFAYTDVQRAVKNRDFKLIEYGAGGRHNMTQLFDLRQDPWELCNLASDPAHAATVAGLRAEMLRLRDAWDDRASEWGDRFWRIVTLD